MFKRIIIIVSLFAVLSTSCTKQSEVSAEKALEKITAGWLTITNSSDTSGGAYEWHGLVYITKPISNDVIITMQWDDYDTKKSAIVKSGIQYKFKIPAGLTQNIAAESTGIFTTLNSKSVNVKIISVTSTGQYTFIF